MLTTHTLATPTRRSDGHLWMTALALSLLFNMLIVVVVGLLVLQAALRRQQAPQADPVAQESTVMVYPEMAEMAAAPAPPEAAPKRFARTSPDQAAPSPDPAPFIGERDTRATSDRTPVAEAPPLPSQAGVEPQDPSDLETTESNYQDGVLEPADPGPLASTEVEPPPPPPAETTPRTSESTPLAMAASLPPPRETLLDGPNPVDVQVPRETSDNPDETPPSPVAGNVADSTMPPETTEREEISELQRIVEPPRPKGIRDPAFQGYQRKTAIVGSISRTGRSSLDVDDTPLGRYQATISRAVEQEWQRNCVRHRDFITPGFLTVRFFVEPTGKVRSVQFVGDMQTGEIQKGFTLNSIRDAAIPAMPAALRKEYSKEPLELIFRFYF